MKATIEVFEIEHETHVYKLEFRTGFPLRYKFGRNKTWHKVTQCVVFVDDLIVAYSDITKHEKDEDNPILAKTISAKKVFEKTLLMWPELRKRFFDMILKTP